MESLLSNQLYVVYALIGTILILLGYIIKLDRKLKKFLIGKDAKTLEDSILSAKENIEKLNIFQKEVIGHFTNVEKRLNRSVQAVETLRFNPFKGTGDGGNQSFSTALINQNGDGVILSSLYSRDRISVFSKPVVKFQSTFELTPEEVEVLNNSKNQLKS
jgi:uncharacterized membrane protein YqgA involved in biofilm formation